MACDLIEDLRKTDQLPTAPGVAIRIVELNQNDEVDIDEIVEVLSKDPALVAKLLKTANSSLFGVPREISGVRDAVMILGLRSVNLLALSFSVIGVSSGSSPEAFDYRRYWTETTATALGARLLAERVDRRLKDEAFLSGLLAGFGQLILAECAPEKYGPVLDKWAASEGQQLHVVEQQELGATNMDVAAELLAGWGLPELVCQAIRFQQDPSACETDAATRLAQLLHFAACCGRLLAGGKLEAGVEQLVVLGKDYFEFDGPGCCEILMAVQEQLPSAAASLELETTDAPTLVGIATQAAQLLVRESLALNEQVQAVTSEKNKLVAQKTDLELKATTDPLTGLRNRGFFDETLEAELERAREAESALGLLMIDLDHFKSVNDTHGHQMGDEVLRCAAAALKGVVGPQDSACRYGGEEFTVICPDVDAAQLEQRADQIRGAIAALEFETENGPFKATASIGACLCQAVSARTQGTQLVELADRELYRAKLDGRNCTRITVPD